MKKILSYIFMFGAVAALTLSSCAKKEAYQPGEPDSETCYGVYFPSQEASGSHTYDPEMERTLTVTVARNQEKPYIDNAITVPYVIKTATEGVFQAGNITFEAGQAETALEINFEKAELGTNYAATLEITDTDYASKYSSKATYLNFDVLVVAWQYILNPKTGEPALFEFTQDYWNETAWAYIKYYEVDGVRTCHTESTGDHIYNGEAYTAPGFWGTAEALGTDGEIYFNMYMNEKNSQGNVFVELLPTPVYINPNYPDTPVHVFDYYYYWTIYQDSLDNSQGLTDSWLQFAKKYESNYPVGYYDGNGGIYFYTRTYGMYGVGGWSEDAIDIVGVGEGFVRTDFSLSLKTDYPADGVTPVYVEAGADVAAIKYAIYPGELKEDEVKDKVNAIAAGTEEATVFSEFELDEESGKNFATLGLSPETTGTYTIAVVGFDAAGAAQVAESLVFNFITADDQADHAVQLEVGTEDVPARYGDYPTNSSFAFYIVGKNIQEAHINIYATETFTENQEAILAEMRAAASGSGVSIASASVLAEINAPGGFYTYTTGLKALTSYTVVVWATNGEMETWQTAEYTTDGLPNEYLCTGTYTYAAWWSGSDNKQELYKNPNIADTYVLPNWGGGVDFVFTMDEEGIITIPTFAIGATHSSYGTVYYVDPFNYWTEAGLAADETRAVHSYFDAESNTYNFHFVLAVNAGSFGHFWETYTPNAEESQANILNNVIAKALASNTPMAEKDTKFTLPSLELKSLPRDPQPVKANVTVSYTRKAKESGRNNMVVTRDSDQRFFE